MRPDVLVVAVWFEQPTPDGFRARVRATRPDSGDEQVSAAASPDEVLRVVRAWLGSTVERRSVR
jgi:hypothetical protein